MVVIASFVLWLDSKFVRQPLVGGRNLRRIGMKSINFSDLITRPKLFGIDLNARLS